MRDLSQSIVLTGQGHWCRVLAEGLERWADVRVGTVPFDSIKQALHASAWRALLHAETVVLVGFRPGAATVRGRAFAAAFGLVRRHSVYPLRVIQYWIGTDVMRALAAARDGNTGALMREASTNEHIAGSPPLAHDLATIGIDAEVIDFPWSEALSAAAIPPMPERFTVLSYVPDARPEFYGGPQILEAARALPDVQFLIVGGTGKWTAGTPGNVRILGWQEDMEPWYAAASCVVRMVEYDSIGATVAEALTRGRTVVYSRPFDHTLFVAHGNAVALGATLRTLADAYDRRPDTGAAAWAREYFDPERRFKRLAERITR